MNGETNHSKATWYSRVSRHPFVVLGIILIGSLGPFVNKAIQTDDALFVWTGQWIQGHPLDFFGAKVVWWDTAIPMWMATMNPPLMSYFLAAVASIFGWHEIQLHFACAGVAFAATAGIYNLASSWCQKPLLATVIAVITPAFLVSASTIMCDVPMLSFWVWSLVVFARAFETKSRWQFALAGALAGLAILTKYSAIMLLPLMALMGALQQRKPGWWLTALVVPLAVMALYELLTIQLYGHALITGAAHYAQSTRYGFPGGLTAKTIIGLTFAGGSLLPILFLSPLLWSWRTWLTGGALIFGVLIGIFSLYNPGLIHSWEDTTAWQLWGFKLEIAILVTAGVQLILIAGLDAGDRRDTISITLLAWFIGVLFFAGVLNWTINARSFLPACPAAAILAVRRLELMRRSTVAVAAPVFLGFGATLSLVIADYQAANSTRSYSEKIGAKYQTTGHNLWIEGHGGFQYYLEKFGGRAVDLKHSDLEPGDIVAMAWNSGNTINLPPGSVAPLEIFEADPYCWMNLTGADKYGIAGFYDADTGPVPFVFGAWTQPYFVAKILSPVQFPIEPRNLSMNQNGAAQKTLNPDAAKQIQLADQFRASGKIDNAVRSLRNALSVDPDNVEALNSLALIFATASDQDVRNGSEAVQLATKAANLTKFSDPAIIGTLAASLAESGDFRNAMLTAKVAQDLAEMTGLHDIAAANAKLIVFCANQQAASAKNGL